MTSASTADEVEAGSAVIAIASNGQILVNAEFVPERLREGREVTSWYMLSPSEAIEAAQAIEALAFNVPAEVFATKAIAAKGRARRARKKGTRRRGKAPS